MVDKSVYFQLILKNSTCGCPLTILWLISSKTWTQIHPIPCCDQLTTPLMRKRMRCSQARNKSETPWQMSERLCRNFHTMYYLTKDAPKYPPRKGVDKCLFSVEHVILKSSKLWNVTHCAWNGTQNSIQIISASDRHSTNTRFAFLRWLREIIWIKQNRY